MSERSPSRIPAPSGLRRSASVRVRGERPVILYSTSPTPFPSISEREESIFSSSSYKTPTRMGIRTRSQFSLNKRDDDLDSLESFGSNFSGVSKISTKSACEHSPFAMNGTTYSGRSQKYVVHCSTNHCSSPDEYLTPTQRANRNITRLKSLLQLAKEKLMEKEREIFKLTKEVVELKVFKASIKNGNYTTASTPSDCNELQEQNGTATYTVDEVQDDFQCDTYADLTPSKTSYSFEDKVDSDAVKSSARNETSPLHAYQRDKLSATPDYMLSSLADSGHFDDLASSLSLQSKDSLHHVMTDEKSQSSENFEERGGLVKMYEAILQDRKESYEQQLQTIQKTHEEQNMQMVDSFDKKLREEEQRFESQFNDLLKSTEQEKIEIVERFEKRLMEEKDDYLQKLQLMKDDDKKAASMYSSDNYILRVEEEKASYELALAEIKEKFDVERQKIEKCFDDAMAAERCKFENAVSSIEKENDRQLDMLNEKIKEYEKKYSELLVQYQGSLNKIVELEKENARLQSTVSEQETRQKEMYLKMYMKGQEAVQFQQKEQVDEGTPKPYVPIPELLVQLKVTEVELENLKDKEYRSQHSDAHGASLISAKEALSLWMLAARKAMYKRLAEAQQRPPEQPRRTSNGEDPEATLQFLKSAVYYFLTDRDNHLEHLRAIESILGFSQGERRDIASHYYAQ